MGKFLRYEGCPRCKDRGRDTSSDNLAVYSDGSKHCFANCGYHVFPKRLVRVENANESNRTENKRILPNDFTREVPARAWQWLLQYGLSLRYWQKYCGYSEKDQRLIFTVGEPTEFSIGRWIGDGEEVRREEGSVVSHMGGSRRKWFAYGDMHKTAHVFGTPETSECIVLVEDIVSAHKVSQVAACIPLFGTNIFQSVISVLRLYRKPVILWLDNDQKQYLIKRSNRLSVLTGCEVNYRITEKDPKAYSINQIEEILNG